MILVNRAKMTSATTGTGTLTLGSASSGYQSFASAGVPNLGVVRYCIEDGTAWEVGNGTYTTSGTTLSRGMTESSTGSAISCSGSQTVFVTALASDVTPYAYGTLFGTGADGDLTITSTTVTLTKDTQYRNLTLGSAGFLKTGSFKLFVSGTLDLTAAVANAITLDGVTNGVGGNATSSAGGAAGYFNQVTFPNLVPPPAPGAGGNSTTGNGPAGDTASGWPTNITGYGYGGAVQVSGAGGSGASGSGGAARLVGGGQYPGDVQLRFPNPDQLNTGKYATSNGFSQPLVGGYSGSGGGAGGGDGTNKGGSGGGGGQGGGNIVIFARIINRSGSTAGVINAQGFPGGNGFAPTTGNCGGGGGGAGGAGGRVWICAGDLIGTATTTTIDVSSGAGGNGAAGVGTGNAGNGAYSGATGGVEFIWLGSPTTAGVYTTHVPPNTWSAPSGTSGGAAIVYRMGF